MVVNQSDDGYALDPKPELSAGLRLILRGDVECHGGDVYVSFKGMKEVIWDVVG